MANQGKQDALKLLAADHREVEDLFEQFEKARDGQRKQKLATQICNALKVHTMIEEEIEHHIKEEEKMRGNIFQQARAADVDLQALGEQMSARKAELKQIAETQGLPPAETRTLETQ